MYNISKETYEIMKGQCGVSLDAGKLVPSKLTNLLVWESDNDADPIRAFGFDSAQLPLLLDRQPSISSPASSSSTDSSGKFSAGSWCSFNSGQVCSTTSERTDSGYENQQDEDTTKMSLLWETLRSIKDECDFCKNMSVQRGRYPKHTLYDDATGMLTCPVVLDRTCQSCGRKGHTIELCTYFVNKGNCSGAPKNKLQKNKQHKH